MKDPFGLIINSTQAIVNDVYIEHHGKSITLFNLSDPGFCDVDYHQNGRINVTTSDAYYVNVTFNGTKIALVFNYSYALDQYMQFSGRCPYP